MKSQFVTYDIAIKLKELGFDEPTMFGFNDRGKLRNKISHSTDGNCSISWDKFDSELYAPLWQQVIDWFILKYSIFIQIKRDEDAWTFDLYEISHGNKHIPTGFKSYTEYSQAREQAILKCFEIIKEK